MNEQAIIDSYNTFVSQGYTKSLDEFKKLIASNPEALQDSYTAFQGVGYKKSLDEYKVLMGISAIPSTTEQQPVAEKKKSSATTVLPSAGSSSAAQLPPTKTKEEEGGILSSIGQGIENVSGYVSGLASKAENSILSFADDVITDTKKLFEKRNPNIIQEQLNPSDPDYQKKLGEQLKAKIAATKTDTFSPLNPLDVMKVVGNVLENTTSKIINSTLSQEQKNAVIKKLQEASDRTKYEILKREKLQEETLDDGITTKILGGIAEFVPDLAVASLMKNPVVLESKYATWSAKVLPSLEKISPKVAAVVEKYTPKIAKFTEEAAKAPMTKIFAVKGAISGAANAKEGETMTEAGVEGAKKGFFEGIYMHGLGVAAGKVSPIIAKKLSKTGMNSAISTAIANPLANAGVFATAKAIRTPIEEGRLATGEELAMEVGTGIGFSLLHAGSLYKNHNELNHLYDNTLKDDQLYSFGRVLNETKANLDLVYDPNLTPEQIAEIKEARDELKKAAIAEPDLQKKIQLGNEALKLQNKLDANFSVKAILENKSKIVDEINKQEDLSDEQKDFFTKKVNAIADHFDNSEVGLKKKELNIKIGETQKTLSDLSEKFTNQTLPSDRAETKLEIDAKTKELEDLNNELNELVKIQKETKKEEPTTATAVETQPTAAETQPATKKPMTFDDFQNEDTKQDLNRLKTSLENYLKFDEEDYNAAKEKFDNSNPIVKFFSKKPTYEQFTKYTKDELELLNNNPEQYVSERIKEQEQIKKEDGDNYASQNYLDFLKDLQTKLKEDAIQKQSTNESVLLTEQPQLGLQEVGKGNERPQETTVTTEGTKKVITYEGKDYRVYNDGTVIDVERDSLVPIDLANKVKTEGKPIETTPEVTPTVTPEVVNVELKPIELTQETTTEATPEVSVEPTAEGKPKTALQEATEARKKAKAALKSLKEGMGISPDAKLKALVKYHKALVNEAKEFIKEKKGDIEAWAKSIGERVTKITQTAWDEATGKIAPIEKGEDLDYTFEETFGEDIESLPDYEKTMEDVEYEADEAYKSINYLKEVLKNAKEKYEKYKQLNKEDRNPKTEQRLKDRLEKAKAELEEYEGYFEDSKNKAIEILKESDLYKNATDIQKELLIRDVESRFGEKQKRAPSAEKILGKEPQEKTVMMTEADALINQLKDLNRGGKDAQKAIKEVAANVASTLKALQEKGVLTVDQVKTMMNKFAKVDMLNPKSVDKFIDYATDVFEKAQEEKTAEQKKTLIDNILELVNKKAKTKILSSGKRRSRGLDPDGQLFFQSVRDVLNAAAKNDTNKMMDIMNKLASRQTEIDEAVQKEMRGEPLTLDETILLNEVMAFDMFGDMLNMSVDEIQSLYDSLKDVRAESIKRLKDKRLESAAKKESMTLEANDNIQEGFGMLFNADGTLKSEKDLNQDHKDIYESFKKLKIWDGLKKYLKLSDFRNKNILTDLFRNKLAHVGTLCNVLDKSGSLFTKNVYDKLNKMNEKKLIGKDSQTKLLDTLANKIFGTKKDGYQKLKYELAGKGTKKININGRDYTFNYGQLLRIYALNLNRVQRGKLEKMGLDSAKMQEIKTALGPEFTKFAEDVVEYLSTDYFETVNDVYRKVNDVNLNQIENYFPTKSISKEVNVDLLQKGDFNGIFNAETSPAFKERLDTTSPIDLEPSFTDVLENHLETMEMYKSHAEGVKEMNTFFSIPSVKTLLDQTGVGPALKFNVNNSISPNASSPVKAKRMDKMMNKFSSFALAFKAMQFVKQASSIGAAYSEYSFRPGKQTFALDLIGHIVDLAQVIVTPRASIKKFKNISATFKERLESGLRGEVASLESGGRTYLPESQKNTILGKFKRRFKSAAGFSTVAGDILSTFGYMANYNRDIKNGMDPEKALEKFNNYNATLQSRRPSEKSAIQYNQDFLTRSFTMFGSSGLLMMNTASQSYTNITRSIGKGEVPKTKDIRKLVFALGVGNALFVAASNSFKLLYGNEDDKDKAKQDIFEAMIGLNLINQLPMIGDISELISSKIKGERYYNSSGTNPFLQLGKKMYKIYDEQQGDIIKTLRPLAEIQSGFQFEPFMGVINSAVEGEVSEDDMYDILGVASSYRPTGKEEQEVKAEKESTTEEKTSKELNSLKKLLIQETDYKIRREARKRIEYLNMDDNEKKDYKKEKKEELQLEKAELEKLLHGYDSKEEMERYDKDLYNKTFGEGSSYYKKHEAKLKMEAKIRKLEQETEDKQKGYTEPIKEKKIRRNKDGSIRKTYKKS